LKTLTKKTKNGKRLKIIKVSNQNTILKKSTIGSKKTLKSAARNTSSSTSSYNASQVKFHLTSKMNNAFRFFNKTKKKCTVSEFTLSQLKTYLLCQTSSTWKVISLEWQLSVLLIHIVSYPLEMEITAMKAICRNASMIEIELSTMSSIHSF